MLKVRNHGLVLKIERPYYVAFSTSERSYCNDFFDHGCSFFIRCTSAEKNLILFCGFV